jgi:hypothetical protein
MVQCQTSKFVKNAAATCPLCGTEDEDLCPFILGCTKLSRIRTRHLQKIDDYLEKIHKGLYIRIVNENVCVAILALISSVFTSISLFLALCHIL